MREKGEVGGGIERKREEKCRAREEARGVGSGGQRESRRRVGKAREKGEKGKNAVVK